MPVLVMAHSAYLGYSSAPGSNGTCTSSCHSQYSFSPQIRVTGFPENYELGEQYTIYVSQYNGRSINQFNASVRSGFGSETAGVLSAGYATAAYTTPNEPNGIHWQNVDSDTGSFIWTAPTEDAGEVRLYWSGLQGTRAYGADTQIVIVSRGPESDVEYIPGKPRQFSLQQNYPNPFNNHTIIELSVAEEGELQFIITNILGQIVYEWHESVAQPGTISITWDGRNRDIELPSGVYFYRLSSKAGTITKKMLLLR